MNILGRNGLFLKNTQTIEKLANNDTIVFDKTGTITTSGESEIEFHGTLTKIEKQWGEIVGKELYPSSLKNAI